MPCSQSDNLQMSNALQANSAANSAEHSPIGKYRGNDIEHSDTPIFTRIDSGQNVQQASPPSPAVIQLDHNSTNSNIHHQPTLSNPMNSGNDGQANGWNHQRVFVTGQQNEDNNKGGINSRTINIIHNIKSSPGSAAAGRVGERFGRDGEAVKSQDRAEGGRN